MTFYQNKYGYKHGDFPVAEGVFDRIVSLPLFPKMKEEDVDRVVAEVTSAVNPEQLVPEFRKSA